MAPRKSSGRSSRQKELYGERRTPPERPQKPPRKPRAGARRSWLGTLVLIAFWGMVAVSVLVAYYALQLPDVSKLDQEIRSAGSATKAPSVTLLASDGSVLATYGDLYGKFTPVSDISPYLPEALIATEDRRFYSNFGIDPYGLMRALVADIMAGHIVQGGSTITQQLAKNLFLTPARTLKRKIQEALLALWLEHKYSKKQILSLYLNRVYFGAGAYGVAAAAERYFSTTPAKLTLPESAMLAGLLNAPSYFNPLNNLRAATARTDQVLDNMVTVGDLTKAQEATARRDLAAYRPPPRAPQDTRYFTDWVFDNISDYVGPNRPNLVVQTTLDPHLQQAADQAVSQVLAKYGTKLHASQGALVALSPDGAVRAMVGGRDYRDSSYNRATEALRQPGSTFKLFVYIAGLEAGLTPTSQVLDAPIRIGKWEPHDYDPGYQGEVTLTQAFAQSLNTSAVRVSQEAGIPQVIAVARRLGITTPLAPDPSIALGSEDVNLLQMTGAYDTVANGGYGVIPYGITQIRTQGGNVLFSRQGGGPGRVLPAQIVEEMNQLLTAVVTQGTGHYSRLAWPSAGKTGTTQNSRDAWFIGYTANLTAGVWIGNDNDQPMRHVVGGTLPAYVWHDFMVAGLAGQKPQPLLANLSGAPSKAGGLWSKIIAEFGGGSSGLPGGSARLRYHSTYTPSTDPAPSFGYSNGGGSAPLQ